MAVKRVNEYGDGVAWVRGSIIGKGAFGCVYVATRKNPTSKYSCLPSVIAVKSAEVSVSGSIQKEKEVFNNVKGCPHIIRCFGDETTMGKNGVMVYNLLLEYGCGGTLADRIKKSDGEGLPELEARLYARSILRGLKHIHALGYVHCDLKPDNILLMRSTRKGDQITDLRAKIGDFGVAKRAKLSKKRKLEPYLRGTRMYLSPEAVMDNVQEAPCDIWALGCIVLEMLTAKPPWEGTNEEILEKIGVGRELPKIPNGISKEARDFLKGCFVRKSEFRFTCEMLLNRPFIKCLNKEDDDEEEVKEFGDLNEIESIEMVSDSDDEISLSEEESVSCSSEEDEEDNVDHEVVSDLAEEKEFDGGVNQSNEKPKQSLLKRRESGYSVSITKPAGI